MLSEEKNEEDISGGQDSPIQSLISDNFKTEINSLDLRKRGDMGKKGTVTFPTRMHNMDDQNQGVEQKMESQGAKLVWGDNQKARKDVSQATTNKQPLIYPKFSKWEDSITSPINKNEDLEDRFDTIVKFYFCVMHSTATTLHLLQARKEESNDTKEIDATH